MFNFVVHFFIIRCYVSVAVLGGLIYAMGGYDGQNRQNTAEKYFPKKNQWSLIQPMNFQRSDASATAFDGNVHLKFRIIFIVIMSFNFAVRYLFVVLKI